MTTWLRDPIAVAATVLAAHRITRLATRDTLPPVAAARRAAVAWLDRHAPAWADGPTCPWCVGVWTSAAAVAAVEVADRAGHGRTARLAATALAASTVAGLLADLEPA